MIIVNQDDNEKIHRIPIFNKNFKHLIRLKGDCENTLEIVYCNAKVEVKIKHESVLDVTYDVQPLYVVPKSHDGRFQTTSDDEKNGIDDAKLKIDFGLELAQLVFATKLCESMNGEKAFVLRKCETFYSDLDVEDVERMNQWDLYDAIAAELAKTNDINRKFVGFMSCTRFDGLSASDEYSYVNLKSRTFANPALGGGFLCLMGSGCFYSWPNNIDECITAFSNKARIDTSQVLDDSNYRRTYSGCLATSLGTLIHELGHVFDLAHTETGLMGNEIDYIHRFFLSENFTEVLPKRNVRSCQLTEGNDGGKIVVPKFTRMKKPGGFLDKYREQQNNDMTFFEPNCSITLWNHRWFTQSTNHNEVELVERTLTSKSALKLVEIRELPAHNSILINFWSLKDKNVNEFAIPTNVNLRNVALFAITRDGDIFKREFLETFA